MKEIKFSSLVYSVENGLSGNQVEQQRREFGRNELSPPPQTLWWKSLLERFGDPTLRILLAAAALSIVVTWAERNLLNNSEAGYLDSVGIFLAVGLAVLVGFLSERKSSREFALLNRVKENIPVKVYRDGEVERICVADVVVGDLVLIDAGDKIPADGFLLKSLGLNLDQSALTGESFPVEKDAISDFPVDANELRRVANKTGCPAFAARGSTAVDGSGLLLVTEVGDATQMGRIARALTDEEGAETPLVQKLARLAKQISVVGSIAAMAIFSVTAAASLCRSPLLHQDKSSMEWGLIFAAAVAAGWVLERYCLKPFFAGMGLPLASKRASFCAVLPMVLTAFLLLLSLRSITRGGADAAAGIELLKSLLLAFVVAVTIIVVAVPEGLPMMVSMSLALNMMKMARENCLVRRLAASETIGSATVICTDKTGTLTANKMEPVRLWLGGKIWGAETFGELPNSADWTRMAEGIAVNSSANLHLEGGEAVGIGNPTEAALLSFLHSRGVSYRQLRLAAVKVLELTHNSDRKFSLVLVREGKGERCFVKGAPERILARCSEALIEGKAVSIESVQENIEETLRVASAGGLRVIALCEKTFSEPAVSCRSDVETLLDSHDFCFVGLVGLADPIRPEVPEAVARCRDAHIQVKMITGDALPTAMTIAREAGIWTGSAGELAITSEEFAQISESELPEAAERIRVLARSTPFDKLRLVKALHQKGEVVAMTGDGTNDAPSLKAADVGLSMGAGGTEVAKEASDIVLVDDNFRSIVTGVWWGRSLFRNIQRFVQFQLSVNAAALLCAAAGPLLGVPLPFTVTQLLWINIIMDTFAAIALSTEPPRKETLAEKPIPRNASIITKTMGVTIVISALYQGAVLFAALFFGWFVDAAHRYDGTIPATDPEYLRHNLQALTVFFTVFVMFQFWHKFNSRALTSRQSVFALLTKNKPFIVIVSLITAVQILMVQTHAVGEFFRTEPLSLGQWLEIAALTFTIVPVVKAGRMLAGISFRSAGQA